MAIPVQSPIGDRSGRANDAEREHQDDQKDKRYFFHHAPLDLQVRVGHVRRNLISTLPPLRGERQDRRGAFFSWRWILLNTWVYDKSLMLLLKEILR
jgi:hypothetical protein